MLKIRLAHEGDAIALAALRWEFRAEGGENPVVSYAEFAASYNALFRAGLAADVRAHVIVWPSERARPFYARHGFTARTEVMELVLRRPDGAAEPAR
jgi:hypothetical protein